MVHIGARLARRFTLLNTEAVDVPGLERFTAHDSRLHRDVRVDVITALAPSAVRQAAAAAARVRDPRLLRVLASGRERIDEESWTYMVTDLPEGLPFADLLTRRRVPARIAGTIIGDAARALEKAADEGIHHGYLRSSSITVANNGRVTVSGLAVDGELAMQAGVGRGANEATDARALGKLYLAAVTGVEADSATERDLPSDLGVRGRKLCVHVIDGTGPVTLDSVLHSLTPIDSRILRDFPTIVRGMPALPAATLERQAREAREAAEPGGDVAGGIIVGADALSRADHAAQADLADERSDAELSSSLAKIDAKSKLGVVPDTDDADPAAHDDAPILREVLESHPEVDEPLGANELHDLYEFDEMVDVQDVNNTTSVWEALLERLHHRWPSSEGLTRRLEHAHARANRAGPIKAAPVLLPLFVIAVIVISVWAFSMLKTPLDPDVLGPDSPQNTYPAFTHSPSPSPSASASASAEPGDE
ncbi:hypothetical protein [Demequina aurantiaca]|uniref:hypothetical protein n=1 Tax=Demequina aurantiaca TaxID=676200 RepID=UPI000781C4B3|nr:hypothetical protein [Demequina aurantiaca]